MKNSWDTLMQPKRNKNNKNQIMLYSVIFLLVIVAVTATIAFALNRKDKKEDMNTTSGEETVVDETDDIDTSVNDNIDSESGDNETWENEAVQESEVSEDKDSEMVDDIEAAPVEVASVDDVEDPQPEGTSGVEMDVNEITSPKHETKDITYGIDVAKWQGVIDWEQVKASGIDFAIIRIGYRTQVNGVIYEDPYAKYNMQQAQANGIKIGVYFFSTAVNEAEAKEEAMWVADYIAPYPITYPVAYNCEGFTDSNNRQYGLSKSERSDIATAFLNYIKSQEYIPMFYAAKNELEQNAQWDTEALSSIFKIWVAQYPNELYSNLSKSNYSGQHAMWQYTSKGNVPGISKPVDINIAYFGYEQVAEAKDNTPQEEATADPAALIDFKEVKETVTAKIEINLRSEPSTASTDTIVTKLRNGDTATRTGIGNNGWSRVEYNGQTLYAVSSYLTTDLTVKEPEEPAVEVIGPLYKEVNEEVTAKMETNLRSEPGTSSADTIVAVLKNGEIVTRTGIGDNGWSRVEYNGQILYAVSSYLTTDLENSENDEPSLEDPEAGIIFTEVNEQVTAKDKVNLRLVPSSESDETIVIALLNREVAIRTGIGNNGWSRVEYNGQTLYAISSYLVLMEEN
jgi:GH25 family lysozyme M1 (1,4-beta-N-acetylmuramidase)/uncharacterized protein YraI